MQFIDGLQQRWGGCHAELHDDGINSPIIPICMGALSIEGSTPTAVHCAEFEECARRLQDSGHKGPYILGEVEFTPVIEYGRG